MYAYSDHDFSLIYPIARGAAPALVVLGMVGWPIALGSVGGALLGSWLDSRFESGVRYTLMLMTAGLMIGCLAAWKAVTEKHD